MIATLAVAARLLSPLIGRRLHLTTDTRSRTLQPVATEVEPSAPANSHKPSAPTHPPAAGDG